jgi:hypothetical protein
MRWGFRAVLAAFLVAILIAPMGMLCAMPCERDAHSCCTDSPQLVNDCCRGEAGAMSIAPEPARAAAATLAPAMPMERTVELHEPALNPFLASTSLPSPQAPPLVLRT